VHGELLLRRLLGSLPTGSSPRAWGTQDKARQEVKAGRFIPTCMGNSIPVEMVRKYVAVHPHVHGELIACSGVWLVFYGSSPRAWGTPLCVFGRVLHDRFIPTCMGNSGREWPPAAAGSVHPHVHGELYQVAEGSGVAAGSSPRAWGTRTCGIDRYPRKRFIPTCMGNSLTPPSADYTGSVHPHVHGELEGTHTLTHLETGSSPRAWGTRAHGGRTPRLVRFIPTCMGNSQYPRAS